MRMYFNLPVMVLVNKLIETFKEIGLKMKRKSSNLMKTYHTSTSAKE